MKKLSVFFALLFIFCFNAGAQFYSIGEDPAALKWKEIKTEKYRIVFPSGTDSLATEYAKSLERWSEAVGKTSGFIPNQNYKRPQLVILHTQTSYANGVVTWTPRRMELFTTPDAYNNVQGTWMNQLVQHESRHVSQMQYVNGRPYKVFTVLTGQLFAGALSALYCGPAFFEGDAVCAETELGKDGRGRNARFMEYYKASLQEGQYRDWWQWRWGSQNRYAPNHYAAGYMAIAGFRSVYDANDFTKRYFEPLTHGWPFPFFRWQKTIKDVSGKNLKTAFREVQDSLRAEWDRLDASRGTLDSPTQHTKDTRLFSSYSELEAAGDFLYGLRSGLDRTKELVRVHKDGRVEKVHQFNSLGGHLSYNPGNGRLYWSETITDPRWAMRSWSEIHYLDSTGKIRRLTKKTRFFNPFAAGDVISVTEYPDNGGSYVVILDSESGEELSRVRAPKELQLSESVILNGHIYVSAQSEDGVGIYLADEDFRPVLGPFHSSLTDLRVSGGELCFVSDIDGTEEYYRFRGEGNSPVRITNLKNGGQAFRAIGDTLYFTTITTKGKQVWKQDLDKFSPARADFSEAYIHPVAEKLSEAAIAPLPDTASIPEPKRYSKAAHLFHFHSWLPAYFKYDAVGEMSSDVLTNDAGLGVTAFFQNDLGTMYGDLGYSAWTKATGWRHSLHGYFSYRGIYPVIEGTVDFNNRSANNYFPVEKLDKGEYKEVRAYSSTDRPCIDGTIKVYVPLTFSSGGWLRGVVPSVSVEMNNDFYSDKTNIYSMIYGTASVRAYSMLPVAKSGIYPRWGIGAELGANAMLLPKDRTNPVHYAYLYGYVPGILRTHGIKLTGLVQKYNSYSGQFSASYAFPFAPVDWSFLGPVAYIRNFEFIGRYSLGLSPNTLTNTLYASVAARLSNLLWVPFDTRIGVSCNYTIGGKPAIGFVFSVSR